MSHSELSWFLLLTILAKVIHNFGTFDTKCLVSFGNTYLLKKSKSNAGMLSRKRIHSLELMANNVVLAFATP